MDLALIIMGLGIFMMYLRRTRWIKELDDFILPEMLIIVSFIFMAYTRWMT